LDHGGGQHHHNGQDHHHHHNHQNSLQSHLNHHRLSNAGSGLSSRSRGSDPQGKIFISTTMLRFLDSSNLYKSFPKCRFMF
jgi:hypothetical protein